MATTTAKQVLYDIASGYKTATGDDTDITYGNITEKVVSSIGGGGGGNIGYKVTFKVDGNVYYIASCQQGESITEPPNTPQGKPISSWKDENDNVITFPFTPNADVELTGTFVQPDLLLHCDDFTDTGKHALTITNNGVTIDTNNKKFGTGSFAFNDSYIEIPNNNFEMRTNDFTIDFWIRPNALSGTIIDMRSGSSNAIQLKLSFYQSTGELLISYRVSGSVYERHTQAILPLNEWSHIALVRKYGGSAKIYVNGVSVWTDSIGVLPTISTPIRIGKDITDTTSVLDGNLDEIRIFNGTCVWTDNFTPPTNPY